MDDRLLWAAWLGVWVFNGYAVHRVIQMVKGPSCTDLEGVS